MHRQLQKATHAKAQTTVTAMAAAHATAMAANVARVVAVMPVQTTRKCKPLAASRCVSPSAQAKTAMRRCVPISRKPPPHRQAPRNRLQTSMLRLPWQPKPTRHHTLRPRPS